jgi:hypothetical protein
MARLADVRGLQGSEQGSEDPQSWRPAPCYGDFTRGKWSRHSDLNRGPAVYETGCTVLVTSRSVPGRAWTNLQLSAKGLRRVGRCRPRGYIPGYTASAFHAAELALSNLCQSVNSRPLRRSSRARVTPRPDDLHVLERGLSDALLGIRPGAPEPALASRPSGPSGLLSARMAPAHCSPAHSRAARRSVRPARA